MNDAVRYRDLATLGFSGYRVGDDGSVWSCKEIYYPSLPGGGSASRLTDQWKRLQPHPDTDRYPVVTLRAGGKQYTRRICRLVLEAFVGLRPPGMECCHFPDRDITNNRLENLRWDTRKANQADATIHGTRAVEERHSHARLTKDKVREILALLHQGKSQRRIAAIYSVTSATIWAISQGRTWKSISRPSRPLDLPAQGP